MEYTSEVTIKIEILENYRVEKIAEQQTAIIISKNHNLQEGIGIHARQIERLERATYEELLRLFLMEAAEKYA